MRRQALLQRITAALSKLVGVCTHQNITWPQISLQRGQRGIYVNCLHCSKRIPSAILNSSEARMQFSLPKEAEASRPYCPYEETGQFIEALYRAECDSWEQLEDYCERLKKFRKVTEGCTEWVREALARIGKIPEHHVAH